MSAPAGARTTASRSSTAEQGSKATKSRARGSGSSTRMRSTAAERTSARREDRRALREVPDRSRKQRPIVERQSRQPRQAKLTPPKAKQLQAKVANTRVPLVVSSMSLLGVGLVATLWLSIAAVSGSYELQRGENEIMSLAEQKKQLISQNSAMNSTPALLRVALAEGLVAGPEPAHLVQHPDGSTTMVGEPSPAEQPPPPPDGEHRAVKER